MAESTWVGLDVHARKVVAGVLDGASGELRTLRVPPFPAETAACGVAGAGTGRL
jgi:hypothetical protein